MQTFLPYPDFKQSAKCLDWRRLGKQRLEAKQILNVLLGNSPNGGWRHHPAVLMWKGHELSLLRYGLDICFEWRIRGYVDSMLPWFSDQYFARFPVQQDTNPPWLGRADFHAAHRAALLAKNFDWYKQYQWTETPCIAYVWPTQEEIPNEVATDRR